MTSVKCGVTGFNIRHQEEVYGLFLRPNLESENRSPLKYFVSNYGSRHFYVPMSFPILLRYGEFGQFTIVDPNNPYLIEFCQHYNLKLNDSLFDIGEECPFPLFIFKKEVMDKLIKVRPSDIRQHKKYVKCLFNYIVEKDEKGFVSLKCPEYRMDDLAWIYEPHIFRHLANDADFYSLYCAVAQLSFILTSVGRFYSTVISSPIWDNKYNVKIFKSVL